MAPPFGQTKELNQILFYLPLKIHTHTNNTWVPVISVRRLEQSARSSVTLVVKLVKERSLPFPSNVAVKRAGLQSTEHVIFFVCLFVAMATGVCFRMVSFCFYFDHTVHSWRTLWLHFCLCSSTQRSRAGASAWRAGSKTRPAGQWWDRSRARPPRWRKC